MAVEASVLQLIGSGCFGSIIGWYLYYINRYRTGEVKLGDLTSVVHTLGGGSILALFKAGTDLFAAYGIGLAIGFFGYFFVLIKLVSKSKKYNSDWFIDGKSKAGEETAQHGMGINPISPVD